jgi:putative transposase
MTNLSCTANRRAWADRFERFEQSGQSVTEFCKAEAVSPASFYQWRRKLRPEPATLSQRVARFVPLKLPQSQTPQPATVMSVELPGGVRVRLEVTSAEATQP